MLGKCVILVGGITLGYWINNEKWKFIRALERLAIARLRRIPPNQDITIDDLERTKFTILQHRLGVALLSAGHRDLGVSQLAVAALAAHNPRFLLQHYQRQLGPQDFRLLQARMRVLETVVVFTRQRRDPQIALYRQASVATQCTVAEEEGAPTSSNEKSSAESSTQSRGARPVQDILSPLFNCSSGRNSDSGVISLDTLLVPAATRHAETPVAPSPGRGDSNVATKCGSSDGADSFSLPAGVSSTSFDLEEEWLVTCAFPDFPEEGVSMVTGLNEGLASLIPESLLTPSTSGDIEDWVTTTSFSGIIKTSPPSSPSTHSKPATVIQPNVDASLPWQFQLLYILRDTLNQYCVVPYHSAFNTLVRAVDAFRAQSP